MKNLTINNLIDVTDGTYYGDEDRHLMDTEVTGVFTNSQKVIEGSMFIPIVGKNNDGHDYIPSAIEKGALFTLSEKKLQNAAGPYILVDSSLKALRDIAEFYLKQLDVKVVGITGSVGKTSTKEMIASILEQQYITLKTDGNYNNEIGLPLTVFRLKGDEEVAVLEMGISDFGEMSRLTKIARPNVAVITNIGYCHLENLNTRDGVLKAKTEIFEGLRPDGIICLNGDDDKLSTITSYNNNKIMFFGKDGKNDIYATDIESLKLKGTKCTINCSKGSISVVIHVPGVHMVYNALAGCAVGLAFGMSLEKIAEGIEKLEPVEGRGNLIYTCKYTIINDCYNANPISMKASIDILNMADERKVCILGDMFELGENELDLHREIGEYVKNSGIDVLITIGELSREINAGALGGKTTCRHFQTKEEAYGKLKDLIEDGDVILVKASHGMEFSKVVQFLK